MKLALFVWVFAVLMVFGIACWLLAHDPWVMLWTA